MVVLRTHAETQTYNVCAALVAVVAPVVKQCSISVWLLSHTSVKSTRCNAICYIIISDNIPGKQNLGQFYYGTSLLARLYL